MMSKKIVWDSDGLSAFLWVNKLEVLLNSQADKEHIILEPVLEELKKVDHLFQRLQASIARFTIADVDLSNSEEVDYFVELQKRMGIGESACISYAKFHDCEYVGSNNLSDVLQLCCAESINLKTTGMVLVEAVRTSNITEKEADDMWSRMLSKRRLLPTANFVDYRDNHYENELSKLSSNSSSLGDNNILDVIGCIK